MDYRVIKIETNAQNLYGWIALNSGDQPIGHIFMQVEIDKKIKFMDAWVHEDFRRKGIFTSLWDERWKYVKKHYKGYIAYAWCLPMSLGLLRKKGFEEGETCIYMEKEIKYVGMVKKDSYVMSQTKSYMKVSHETPLCLLNDSKRFNDYDYCLPHLLDEEPAYETYFRNAKKEGRYIIMDNSLHELGEAYDHARLIHWINELKPNEFIVPDVWENCEESMQNAEIWNFYEFPKEVEKVAVVQAKTLHEASECTKMYKHLGYKKIAYSYGASYYNDVCPHPNKDLGKALGRLYVITSLIRMGDLNVSDRVHLLGCAVPQEFGWYHNIPCIESIDTSNPVMAALEGTRYTLGGLAQKPKANMNDYFYMLNNQVDYELLEDNLSTFRMINNLVK